MRADGPAILGGGRSVLFLANKEFGFKAHTKMGGEGWGPCGAGSLN